MRLIEAWNRPVAGRPTQRDLTRAMARLSRESPPAAAFSTCRPGSRCAMGAFAAMGAEERLQDSVHTARSIRSKKYP